MLYHGVRQVLPHHGANIGAVHVCMAPVSETRDGGHRVVEEDGAVVRRDITPVAENHRIGGQHGGGSGDGGEEGMGMGQGTAPTSPDRGRIAPLPAVTQCGEAQHPKKNYCKAAGGPQPALERPMSEGQRLGKGNGVVRIVRVGGRRHADAVALDYTLRNLCVGVEFVGGDAAHDGAFGCDDAQVRKRHGPVSIDWVEPQRATGAVGQQEATANRQVASRNREAEGIRLIEALAPVKKHLAGGGHRRAERHLHGERCRPPCRPQPAQQQRHGRREQEY